MWGGGAFLNPSRGPALAWTWASDVINMARELTTGGQRLPAGSTGLCPPRGLHKGRNGL